MMIKYESHTKLDDLVRMEKIQQTSNMKLINYLEILNLEKKWIVIIWTMESIIHLSPTGLEPVSSP